MKIRTNPKLSIVSTTYNQEKYIRQALDSFLMQKTNFDFEVVVADDCSTDKTPEIIREYVAAYPKIFKPILRTKNIGAIANTIESLKVAKGQYIALCEGDDYWINPLKLQKQVDFLDSRPTYTLCFHPVNVMYDDKPDKNSVWPKDINPRRLGIADELKENFIPTNSVVFRRQNYDKIPRDIMPLDWYLHLYNAQFGKIGFIDEVMSVYRKHRGGLWWANDTNKSLLWEKYGLSMIALHTELLKLYGKDPSLREIIHKSIKGVFTELAGVDKKRRGTLINEFVKRFPNVAEHLLTEQSFELEKQTGELESQQAQIEELNAEIVSVRAQSYQLRDELHALTHARLLGRIIKLRNIVGSARKMLSIKRLLHRTRVVIAPFIPAPIRKSLKYSYRKARRILLNASIDSMQAKTVKNESWPSKLPLVSVVIPYFNRADTIDDTMESLKLQTFKKFETIIVDDGSTEPVSIKKFADLKKLSMEVSFINQQNGGVATARNNGIGQARGKYIICLDSDDGLEPTFIEKATVALETSPDISLVTTHMETFGVIKDPYKHIEYDPMQLIRNNMVITAAEYKKTAWENTGGYKSNIGYEDWEYWVNLAEHGFWGKLIPEPLFMYRTSMQSRYVDDKDAHWSNMKSIQKLHPQYKQSIKKLLSKRRLVKNIIDPATALMNLDEASDYNQPSDRKGNILIIVPWMTFGGAETLILNFTREVKDDFNLTFITGLQSEHEWEYKFKDITDRIYHLTNLFEEPELYLEFISNYIKTRKIDAVHIIHTDYAFPMLPELKQRHAKMKILVTLFNDRAAHFSKSLGVKDSIDAFSTDNNSVYRHYLQELAEGADLRVIPNGINTDDTYNPVLFDRKKQRDSLGIDKDDLAVFFVGRMSEEKNPDVFLKAAEKIVSKHKNVKFFLVGDGPMTPQLNKQIETIGSKNVQHLGYQADVPTYLSSGDIFVLASSIEGFPLSILEAMAMRLAVVASDVGAVSEIINSGQDGFVVTPGSVDEIVEAIDKLRSSPKLLENIKRNARQSVEKKYSNKILGANYRKLYKDLLK